MTNSFSKPIVADPGSSSRKCRQCSYVGAVNTFPRTVTGLGYKTKCPTCDEKDKVHQQRCKEKLKQARAEVSDEKTRSPAPKPEVWRWEGIPEFEMSWEEALEILVENKDKPFVMRAVVDLTILLADLRDSEKEGGDGIGIHRLRC
ncbi:hypothetical protein PM082_001813 [Marasmius tenuissimus]|nr:hypothetical protein PM082_001813 [Marasmius tenuissimus]